MKHTIQPSRLAAAATGLALVAGTFTASSPASARPRTNSKTYKTGAIALGVLGAYLLSKGKTVEGAAVLGGGYLAYKKGQKVQRDERYGRYNYPRYGYNPRYNAPNDRNYGNPTGYDGNSNSYDGNSNGYDNGNDYRLNDTNQSGDWNSGWSGSADVRPQRGNNGHHYGQNKHHRGDDNRDGGDEDRD